MPESLYIHIPFCLRKCGYCDFVSIPFDEGLSERYAEALLGELRMRGGSTLRTLYIGGGTPTVLSAEALRGLFGAVRGAFELSADAEITVEANPGTVTGAKLRLLRSLGANRLSMGVQSFSDGELKTLGRLHTAGEAYEAALLAKGFFDNFSMDLIYAVPGQTLESWRTTLETAIGLCPSHISAYELTPEKCTPLYDALKKGELELPDEDAASDMFQLASEVLESAGLGRYEISNYCRTGFECRHNMNYWRRGEYIGAGAGAHSFVGNKRIRNTENVFRYIELLSEEALPAEDESEVTAEEALKEKIFLGLRTAEGIEAGERLIEAAQPLMREDFMEKFDERLRLTQKGIAVSNSVIVELMRRLGL